MLEWKYIKDNFPRAFKTFQTHEGNEFYGWDVIDINLKDFDTNYYDPDPDFDLFYIKGLNTSKPYIYSHEEKCISRDELYSFFDKQGLNVVVQPLYDDKTLLWEWKILWYLPKDNWLWHGKEDLEEGDEDFPIMVNDAVFSPYNEYYKNRYQAEVKAFTKAFEILNDEHFNKKVLNKL